MDQDTERQVNDFMNKYKREVEELKSVGYTEDELKKLVRASNKKKRLSDFLAKAKKEIV